MHCVFSILTLVMMEGMKNFHWSRWESSLSGLQTLDPPLCSHQPHQPQQNFLAYLSGGQILLKHLLIKVLAISGNS